MKLKVLNGSEVDEAAADALSEILQDKPDAVIALPVGNTYVGFYNVLAKRVAEKRISLREVHVIVETEFIGNFDHYSEEYINRFLIERTDLLRENVIFLSNENIGSIDSYITDCYEKLDASFLGLGENGSFAYNEPGTGFASPSHIQRLSPATLRGISVYFEDGAELPEKAFTLGISSIVSSKKIIILVKGSHKSEALYKMLYARDDGVVPAAFLQLPYDVTVFSDFEAASKL